MKRDGEHVHKHGQHHQVRRPGMGRADQPPELDVVGDPPHRVVRFRAGSKVDQQQHAGHDLHQEEEQRDAAQVVPERNGRAAEPACAGPARSAAQARAVRHRNPRACAAQDRSAAGDDDRAIFFLHNVLGESAWGRPGSGFAGPRVVRTQMALTENPVLVRLVFHRAAQVGTDGIKRGPRAVGADESARPAACRT